MNMITKIFNRIIIQFIPEREDRSDMESKTRTLLLNVSNFLFFLAILAQGIISLIQENLILAAPLLFLSVAFTLNYSFGVREDQANRFQNMFLFILFLTLSFFVLTGGNSEFDGYWSVFYPLITMLICGRKHGLLWSLGLLGVIIIIFVFPFADNQWIMKYSWQQQVFVLSSYIIALILGYTFQFIRSEVSLEKDRQILESENHNRAQESLINKLSYQIRTPLNNITGILELLNNTEMNEEQRDYLYTIHASTNNLVNVVKDLVVTSTTYSHDPENQTSFNLYTTLNNTLRLFTGEANMAKTRFNLSLSADIPATLTGNSIKVKQIFLNLINSITKNNNQPAIFISIEVIRMHSMPGKIELLFKITTNMVAPKENESNRNDEGFYNYKDVDRINNSRLIDKLDLGITLKIIESEGKSFTLVPQPDSTIFEFTLSFAEGSGSTEPVTKSAPPLSHTNETKPGIALKDATILLAEDNLSNQQIIILYIKNEVKKIDVALNGREALEKFGHAKYDLILMDVQMPIMDGYRATQKIREIEQSTNTHTPIVAVTANAFPEDQERCLESGMDGYISKPFQPDELLVLIQKHLR